MQALTQQIKESIENLPALSHLLHILKGCAGQAGLTELYEATIQLERVVENREIMTQQDITQLDEIINLLFNSQNTCNSALIIK